MTIICTGSNSAAIMLALLAAGIPATNNPPVMIIESRGRLGNSLWDEQIAKLVPKGEKSYPDERKRNHTGVAKSRRAARNKRRSK